MEIVCNKFTITNTNASTEADAEAREYDDEWKKREKEEETKLHFEKFQMNKMNENGIECMQGKKVELQKNYDGKRKKKRKWSQDRKLKEHVDDGCEQDIFQL